MDRVVVVTGGTQGIGRMLAQKFLMEHDTVIIASRNEAKGRLTEQVLSSYGVCRYIQADVILEDECKRLIDNVADTYGRIDVLVNNAAFISRYGQDGVQDILDTDISKLKASFDINVAGALQMAKYAGRIMADLNKGVIINIGSIAGVLGICDMPEYCISKSALSMLTKCLALQLAPYGIRCVNVCPGWVETENNGLMNNSGNMLHMGGKALTMEKISDTVYFLSTEEASAINGTDIFADDGYSAFKGDSLAKANRFSGFRFRKSVKDISERYSRIMMLATAKPEILMKIIYQFGLAADNFKVFANESTESQLANYLKPEQVVRYRSSDRMNVIHMNEEIQTVKTQIMPDCIIIPCSAEDADGYDNVFEFAVIFKCDIYWIFADGKIRKAE